jgi:UDP-2,4-diacetamido-2,4,6-trideoxy-beta-L-altropyranose hydrolase
MKTVVFRIKGGKDYGWGHVVRMAVLAGFIKNKFNNVEISFVVEGSEGVIEYIRQRGFGVYEIPFDLNGRKEESWWPFEKSVYLIIVDLLRVADSSVKFLRRKCEKLVIFSDIQMRYPFADILVYPQVFELHSKEKKTDQIVLKGLEYFILDKEYLFFRNKHKSIPLQARSLLVCLGGAAHTEDYSKLVQALVPIEWMFETMDFIIGFESDIGLEAYLQESLPKANFIKSESGLSRRLYESDIAIIAGGFIKYELAAVGTPGIIVSVVEHQHELSVMFSAKKAAEYIGILSELTAEQIRRSVTELSSDSSLRMEMSFAGKRLVDCLALERLTPFLIT